MPAFTGLPSGTVSGATVMGGDEGGTTIKFTAADVAALASVPTSAVAFSATPTISTATTQVIYFGALTANVTAFNLSGTQPKVIVCFVQDGTGGRTVAAGTSIDFGGDIANLSGVAAGAGAYTYVGFIYNPTTTKFRVVALAK